LREPHEIRKYTASCWTAYIWLLVYFIRLRASLVGISCSIYYKYLNTLCFCYLDS
jgi:hypothetical protein